MCEENNGGQININFQSEVQMAWGLKTMGVRSTLIWSIRGAKSLGGLPHTGVPEIVQPP
jgi:hypothetical protein